MIDELWKSVLKNADKTKKHFTILLPPPNITGSLHIGHFFNWCLQDLLMRKAYIDGLYPNWLIGVDHAGIATEYVVERQLKQEGQNKYSLGYTNFIGKILEWQDKAIGMIEHQAEEFSFFADWTKKRYTMDENYQASVIDTFCRLYEDGLIHKKEMITNWDTTFQTAISDLEIIEKTETRTMYHIRYDNANGDSIIIATTRPETIFADSAIAVHPDDERYANFTGTFFIPLINREIPLIKETLCESEKGTGALKVTPAHDKLDNEIGQKHNLQIISIIDKQGKLFNVPDEFAGLTALEARPLVVEALRKSGHLIAEEAYKGIVHYGEKSSTIVETIMTEQWFLDVRKMAELTIASVEKGEIELIPGCTKEILLHWMRNIKPWCISRQIWWGHRIPIWYTEKGEVICARTEAEARAKGGITQETDVLDTWFSSAIWPTIQEKYEPTDVLITGRDILFFWVARMIMFSLYLKKTIPFKKVYFNGIVRDENNQKMSKTKGNVLNPLDLKQEYGQDALRIALIKHAAWAKDFALKTENLLEGRAFCTKLKNAAIFIKQHMKKDYSPNSSLDDWIEAKITTAKMQMDEAIANYAFHDTYHILYDVFWNNFCSWYIEGLKLYPSQKAERLFFNILKLAHPIIPLATEECYTLFSNQSIMNYDTEYHSTTSEFDKITNVVKFLRKLHLTAGLKSFAMKKLDENIYETEKIIAFYTKLAIDDVQNFEITIENMQIFIDKSSAMLSKQNIENEISKINLEIAGTQTKLATQAAPEEIRKQWEQKIAQQNDECRNLQTWLNALMLNS